jgi:hypothetical protein
MTNQQKWQTEEIIYKERRNVGGKRRIYGEKAESEMRFL